MQEKLKELLSNEDYVKELVALKEPAKIRDRLLEDDIDISVSEIENIIKLLKKKASGELSDKELQEVAGGIEILGAILLLLGTVAVGGTLIAIATC